MQIRAGTSGYSYKEWKGSFYPKDLPDRDMLAHYATRLPSVEVNNTFYRMPSAKLIDKWREQTSESFRFVLKATRRITHHARLVEVDDLLAYLFETTSRLGPRLGAHLFQMPPYARKEIEALAAFLERVPEGERAAFEFRHASWFDDDVYDVLHRHDAALVLADGEKVEVPEVATASWGYLRLRRDDYRDEELAQWAASVRSHGWTEAYVFFKHEDEGAGPALAERFLSVATDPA